MKYAFSNDGTKIAYEVIGNGPPLILVNGALSERTAGADTAEMLSSEYSCFIFDRRGRGDSGDTQPYAVDREIEDIAAVLEAAGGTARLYGHSSGAVLALDAADRLPGIGRLAVYEPPFIASDDRQALRPEYSHQLAGLISAGRHGEAVEHFMMRAVGIPQEAVTQVRQSPMWKNLEKLAPTLLYDQAIMEGLMAGKPLPDTAWAGVTIPVLVMSGGASPAWFTAGADDLCRVLERAERRVLPGQDHGPRPDLLVPVLREFFAAE